VLDERDVSSLLSKSFTIRRGWCDPSAVSVILSSESRYEGGKGPGAIDLTCK